MTKRSRFLVAVVAVSHNRLKYYFNYLPFVTLSCDTYSKKFASYVDGHTWYQVLVAYVVSVTVCAVAEFECIHLDFVPKMHFTATLTF